jgi:hypothetical protein
VNSFGFAEVYRLDEVSAIAKIIFGKGIDKVSAIRQSSLHIATTDRTNHMYVARTKFMGCVAASGVSHVLHAERQYIRAAQRHIEEQAAEIARLKARLAYAEKTYHEIVPEHPVAWIDHDNVVTNQDVFHTAVVRFLELNVDAFDELLATMHKAYVESENDEALIAAKGEF